MEINLHDVTGITWTAKKLPGLNVYVTTITIELPLEDVEVKVFADGTPRVPVAKGEMPW